MKRLPFFAFALAAVVGAMNSAVGCGSEDDNKTTPTPDSGQDTSTTTPPKDSGSFINAILDGGRTTDAFACSQAGTACTTSGECCTGNCAAPDGGGTKVCQATGINNCTPSGTTCPADPTQCCLGACLNGTCGSCVDNNGACGTSADCCGGGTCLPDGKGGGYCQAINCAPAPCTPTKKTSGNSCTSNAECASGFCNNGLCNGSASFCTQTGDVCSTDSQCCGGACTKAIGAQLGVCNVASASGVGGCTVDGQLCPAGGCDKDCCSHACGPFGAISTFDICEPASGCKPTGDLCQTSADCCGDYPPNNITCSKADPNQAFGRCNQGNSCNAPGQVCKIENYCTGVNNCCEPVFLDGGTASSSFCNSNPENCCRKDALGIPRCLFVASDCNSNPPPPGTKCATSADCCGKPCVNDQCQGACIEAGGTCTTAADCCSGLPCVALPGSTTGICNGTIVDGGVSDAAPVTDSGGGGNLPDGSTCSLYGQACNGTTVTCCNLVPCTNGTCHFP